MAYIPVLIYAVRPTVGGSISCCADPYIDCRWDKAALQFCLAFLCDDYSNTIIMSDNRFTMPPCNCSVRPSCGCYLGADNPLDARVGWGFLPDEYAAVCPAPDYAALDARDVACSAMEADGVGQPRPRGGAYRWAVARCALVAPDCAVQPDATGP